MSIARITKWIVPALVAGMLLVSCSKNDDKDPDNNNAGGKAFATVVHEQEWNIDASLAINQRVGSHRKSVGAVMEVGGKTYHHQIYNTGYQVTGSICEFNGSEWVNCTNSGYNINLANTAKLIANVSASWVSKTKTSEITTQLFDSDLQQWKIYEQSINDNPASGVKIASANNTLLLATYMNQYEPIDLYHWNNTTKKWDLLIDDLEGSENWNDFHILPGINNEFLFRVYEKDNDYSYKFYTLNGTTFSHLYTTKKYDLVNGLSVCNVHPYKGQYILVDGNVEVITGINSTKPLVKGLSGGNIYIAGFNVIYQIYNEKQDFKQGGRQLGGTYKGDAHAEVSVGLDGLTDQDVQQITDKLYADYITQLKAKGLTVIDADAAEKTDTYSDLLKVKGGTVSLAQFPGTMSTSPTGYEYFIKKMNKSGKAKSGGFLGNVQSMYPKLSKELDDAIIADVNMYVMFVEDKNAFKGNGANIKIKTNLRLAGSEAIVMTDDRKGPKLKGQNTVTAINSAINFYHGKIGMGATSSYVGSLKKGLAIEGVIEDTKIQSFANRSQDFTGVQTMYGTFFNPDNVSAKTARVVAVDAAKYNDGVYRAANKFMAHHTGNFLNSF